MRRSYKYKAKLPPSVTRKAEWQLARLAELYNAALEERQTAWKQARKRVTYFDQTGQLPPMKESRPEYREIASSAQLNCLKRLDLAFASFYRRCRTGGPPGYPRFKSARRYDSMTLSGGWKLKGRRLTVQGIGTAKLFLSRPIEGRVKTVTLKRDACGDWWVVFSCDDVPTQLLPDTGKAVGIDLGLTTFAALSNGELIDNPRDFRTAEARLRHAGRRVAKKKRGGSNRRRARRRLAKQHRRVADVRRDFHWKLARSLVERFDLIAVEDLNVKGMARGMLAKSVHDAGWDGFLHALASEAEKAGRELVNVDPRGTSQACSGCGVEVRKTLAERTHRCSDCGLILDRDTNAARNILALATTQAESMASRPGRKTAA